MSDGPGAGTAIGLVLSVAVLGAVGYAAYDALSDDAPGKWVYAGIAAGLLLLHGVAFAAGLKLITRGIASATYAVAAIAAVTVWIGVGRDHEILAFGLSLESIMPKALAVLITVGAIALPAMPSSNPGRAVGGLVALAAVAPWWIGVWTRAAPEAILAGTGQFYESWPAFVQPALIGGAIALLVLVLAGVAVLGGRKHPDQRALALCALLIPGAAGALMVAYVTSGGEPDTGDPVADAAGSDGGVPQAITRRTAPDAAPPPEPRPTAGAGCSGVIFPDRDISELRDGFDKKRWRESAIAVLEKRFPDAAWMVGTLKDPGNFDVWFTGQTDSWSSVMVALGTGVHEAAHITGLALRRGRKHVFIIGEDDLLEIRIPKSFHRSEIAEQLPDEVRALSYTDTYLAGKSGAQGFEMVLEELNAYTYSLYAAIITAAEMRGGMSISGRDGLFALMYYTEAYLRLARTDRAKTYAAITGDVDLVAAIIKLYDRAACVVELSGDDRRIGINDVMLREHVLGEKRLGEIDRLR